LALRQARGQQPRIAVDVELFPQTRAVLATRAEPLGVELLDWDPLKDPLPSGVAAVVAQYQGARGRLVDLAKLADLAHAEQALLIAVCDPLALTLLRAPGDAGCDVAVGSTGRFGMPLGFGGPHAAFMAVRQDLVRQLPGRLVGLSRDSAGNPALRLALQTREQHIRRERATSNICTAQVLPAIMAAAYAIWHGPKGLLAIAQRVHQLTTALAAAFAAGGLAVRAVGFDTVYVDTPGQAAQIKAAARQRGIAVWADADNGVGISVDETTSQEHLAALCAAFAVPWPGLPSNQPGEPAASANFSSTIALPLRRTSDFLTHPVFHQYHSETELMRYLRRLVGRDYALDRGMIPLGSCTMKLNAAVVMAALTWPGFADLHPFVDRDDAAGTLRMADCLATWLADLTGYQAVSLQPNAGSQGELAGLLAIRGYHRARGQAERTICLIPESAHGTNAASAAAAGFTVVSVANTADGAIDFADLTAKLMAQPEKIAAIMLTYPSTFGVYEAGVAAVCQAVHDVGALVYIDGANFNALVGWAAAGQFGGDVSHLNLHKTFASPHGGGGPGVGPLAVSAELAGFLPSQASPNEVADQATPTSAGPIAAAPYGSALILLISWAYIRLMGGAGLARATESAVLSANYLAARLGEVFPVLYRGADGLVAHECVFDLRPLASRTGFAAQDVAKRLVDYGFHAPTMSFPVPGTLMVEPTESESLAELDRFCQAMLQIAQEAQTWSGRTDGPLSGAPHTAQCLVAEDWDKPYSRQTAVYPAGIDPDKYWPPVGRIDDAWGDRRVVCVLPGGGGLVFGGWVATRRV
jgi:glycine dehydrogenase